MLSCIVYIETRISSVLRNVFRVMQGDYGGPIIHAYVSHMDACITGGQVLRRRRSVDHLLLRGSNTTM